VRHKRVYVKPTGNSVKIFFLGDIHEGASNSRNDLLKVAVDMIAATEDAYWIGMGDMIDCINYHDRRFNVREVDNKYSVGDLDNLPKVQADYLLGILEPIKGKCLGMLTGNHEETLRQYGGFDIMSYLCLAMNVTYLGKKAYVSVGGITHEDRGRPYFMVDICVGHGNGGGGGKTAGGAINKCFDYMQWETADIHVIGHLHSMCVRSALRNCLRGDTLVKNKVYYGVNGSFLIKSSLHSDSYFEDGIGMETIPGMLMASFNVNTTKKDNCGLKLEPIELL
jgi:hypothetical protein